MKSLDTYIFHKLGALWLLERIGIVLRQHTQSEVIFILYKLCKKSKPNQTNREQRKLLVVS